MDILKNENLSFYGKKISEMNENELNLLIIDIQLGCSMECEKLGIVITQKIGDEEILLGTQETMETLTSKRLDLLSEILGLIGAPLFILLVMSEGSEYSFDHFCCDLFAQLADGSIEPIVVDTVFTHPFSMN